MTAQTPRPAAILAPAEGRREKNGALVVRMPATPTEERTLGARAILISARGQNDEVLDLAANTALDTFDQSSGTSPTELARSIISALRNNFGEKSQICMIGMGQREAWIATTGGLGAAAAVMRETRHVTIPLPSGAPGAGTPSATRQGVTVGRLPLREGDRIALANTQDGAVALLRHTSGDNNLSGLVLELQTPVAPKARSGEEIKETLFSMPADNVAQAKARARARWEEGNVERTEQIAATVPPKPTGDPYRPDGSVEPYAPIDRAAQEVIKARRGGGVRSTTLVRGPETRSPRPTRESRAADATRIAAKARAERGPGAEPYAERSRAERAISAPTPVQRAAAALVSLLERRLPQLANKVSAPKLNTERSTAKEKAGPSRRNQRLTASVLLAAVLIAATGGLAAVFLNQSNPNLNDAATARNAMNDARAAIAEALNPAANLLVNDPDRARTLLIAAAVNLKIAEAGGTTPSEIVALRAQMEPALNKLFFLTEASVMEVFDFSSASAPVMISSITQGPDGYAYIVDDRSGAVYRVDPAATPNPRATVVFQPGYDLYGSRTGRAQAVTSSGPDLVIFDSSSNLWRWRPADSGGRGTLVKISARDSELWGNDVKIISGFAADEGTGLYRLYVVDPSARQILRYTPAPDGTGYPAPPTGYLINPTSLASVDAMSIDGDLYLAQNGALRRYAGGAADDWSPADPGDSVLRSPPQISWIYSISSSRTGVLYAWDAANQRMLAYSKGGSGSVLAQYRLVSRDGAIGKIVGGYISVAADGGAPTFVWAEGTKIRSAVLGSGVTPGGDPTAAPTAAPIIELPSTRP